MDAIENAAFVSVGRACGFAGLGIFCLVFGLSFDPPLAARAGGLSCLAVSVVLIVRGWRATQRPYKKTELWLILPSEHRPPAAVAQQVIGGALRRAYAWFAQQAALLAVVLLSAAFAIQMVQHWRA